MITRQHLDLSLKSLDEAFRTSANADDAQRFAKLAIIELCGWTEEAMDSIIRKCAQRRLIVAKNLDYCNKAIKRTYGFDYNKHFRPMLIILIGLISVEHLENSVDQAKHDILISTLGNLKGIRDLAAHTHLTQASGPIDAPSVTRRRFDAVYCGLLDLSRKLRRAGF